MGQYYTPYLKDENNNTHLFYTHDFDNGLKLMEHSWVGNNMMNQILNTIEESPCEIAWVGDYAEYEDIKDKRVITEAKFNKINTLCNSNWHSNNYGIMQHDYQTHPNKDLFEFNYDTAYLVNDTLKCFIDLKKHIENNKDEDGFCANPLSLLTAVGNGKGGGDYQGTNENEIGTWAFNTIRITRTPPKDYTEVFYTFKENF